MKVEDINVLDLYSDPRKDMGNKVPLLFYRLMNLIAVGESMGKSAPDALYESGRQSGLQIVEAMAFQSIKEIEQFFEENGIGILTVEPKGDGTITATMAECAACFGMPRMEVSLCDFECGLVTGCLEALAGTQGTSYVGKETECTSLGDFLCKFEIQLKK